MDNENNTDNHNNSFTLLFLYVRENEYDQAAGRDESKDRQYKDRIFRKIENHHMKLLSGASFHIASFASKAAQCFTSDLPSLHYVALTLHYVSVISHCRSLRSLVRNPIKDLTQHNN